MHIKDVRCNWAYVYGQKMDDDQTAEYVRNKNGCVYVGMHCTC